MAISIRNILVPTDFSKASKAALQYAMMIAEKAGAKLHLLHIVRLPMTSPRPATPWVSLENQMHLQAELAQQRLSAELPANWRHDQRAFVQAVMGFEVEEIIGYADKHEVDLIVMGTNGRTGLSHFLLGSVAEKVVRLSHCPVMTTRATEESLNEQVPQSTITPTITPA